MFNTKFSSSSGRIDPHFSSSGGSFDSNFDSLTVLKGEDGFSPIVNVTTIENGYRLSITDKTHTEIIDINNGEDGTTINNIEFTEDGYLNIYLSDGTVQSCFISGGSGGSGEPGKDGKDGVGIERIEIVNNDIFKYNPTIKFDIVTMIGSAVEEIGFYKEIFKKATSMLSDNGELFYSCVTKEETKEQLVDALAGTGAFVADYKRLEKYGLVLIVSKITREH